MTPFQKKVFCIIDTTIEEEHGLKQVCDELLGLAHDEIMQKPAWSEEDEGFLDSALWHVKNSITNGKIKAFVECPLSTWLKSLKDRVQSQNTWKPSVEQINGIECAIKTLHHQLNVGDRRLDSLYYALKKLKG